MRILRLIIFGLPFALILLLGLSFYDVRMTPSDTRNMMVIASIGEPKMLNPIQAADASASAVMDFVFDGLLALDENLETTGRLAESWTLTQTSTAYFVNERRAQEAAAALEAVRDRWEEWALLRAEAEGREVRLYFSKPGMQAPREALEGVPAEGRDPVQRVRVALKSSARDSYAHFKEQSRMAERIKRVWYDYNAAYELTFVDHDGELLKELEAYYSANADLEPEITPIETLDHLDEPELRFKLRRDVTWHDGYPFTSKDVEFTFRRIMDETIVSPRKPDYDLVQAVETPTPHDLRITYRKPYSPVLNSWMIGVLPEHILGDKDSGWWAANFNREPVGTGAYKFQRWETNDRIELTRNPDYFRGAPHLEAVAFRVIPDPTSIRVAFETQQSDTWNVDPHAVGRFAEDDRFDVFRSPGNGYTYVGWNLRRPLFQDARVRRALAHAVDVEAIIKFVLYGYGDQCTGMWDPQRWWYNEGVKPLAYDPEKAKALLAEAGWKAGADGILRKDGKPFAFTLITNHANEVRKDVATLVQAALRKVGIQVKVEVYEWAVFLSQFIDKGDFDACVLGWTYGADYDQYQIWHSSQSGPGKLNFVNYQNPEVDGMLENIRSEFDEDEIARMAGEIQRKVYDDQPYLFLYVPATTSVIWKDTYRVYRPDDGGWLEEPVRMTKAGFMYYREYFYRPEYAPMMTH